MSRIALKILAVTQPQLNVAHNDSHWGPVAITGLFAAHAVDSSRIARTQTHFKPVPRREDCICPWLTVLLVCLIMVAGLQAQLELAVYKPESLLDAASERSTP